MSVADDNRDSRRTTSRRQQSLALSPLPAAARIDRSKPIPDQVYALLRQSIIALRLPPGAMVVESLITDQLGISRTPVRDAIRQLADEGLLVIKPQSGTFVARILRHDLEEGRLIRRALELEGIRLAALRIDQAGIDALETLITAQERAGNRGDHEAFIGLDDAFHRAISEASGHPRLWRIIHAAKAQLDRVRHLAAPLSGQETLVRVQHQAVVDALAAHDPEAATRALGFHLDDAFSRLHGLLDAHRDMFD